MTSIITLHLDEQTSCGDTFSSFLQHHAEERPDLMRNDLFRAGTHYGSESDQKDAKNLIRLMKEQMGIHRHVLCTGHHRLTTWSLLALREAPQIPEFHSSPIQMCSFFVGHSSQMSFTLDHAGPLADAHVQPTMRRTRRRSERL